MGDAMKFWPFRKRENTVTLPAQVDGVVTLPAQVDGVVTLPSKQRRWEARNRDKVRADTRERTRRYRARRRG